MPGELRLVGLQVAPVHLAGDFIEKRDFGMGADHRGGTVDHS